MVKTSVKARGAEVVFSFGGQDISFNIDQAADLMKQFGAAMQAASTASHNPDGGLELIATGGSILLGEGQIGLHFSLSGFPSIIVALTTPTAVNIATEIHSAAGVTKPRH